MTAEKLEARREILQNTPSSHTVIQFSWAFFVFRSIREHASGSVRCSLVHLIFESIQIVHLSYLQGLKVINMFLCTLMWRIFGSIPSLFCRVLLGLTRTVRLCFLLTDPLKQEKNTSSCIVIIDHHHHHHHNNRHRRCHHLRHHQLIDFLKALS